MPRFPYKAIDAAGQIQRGEMEAASEAEVVSRVQARGQMLLHADAPSWHGSILGLLNADLGARSGLGRKAVMRMTRELAVMLDSGQDIDHALRFMVSTAPDAKSRLLLEELRDAIQKASTGQEVTLQVVRGKQEMELKARLQEAPATADVPGWLFERPEGFRQFSGKLLPFFPDMEKVPALEKKVQELENRIRELEQKRTK